MSKELETFLPEDNKVTLSNGQVIEIILELVLRKIGCIFGRFTGSLIPINQSQRNTRRI